MLFSTINYPICTSQDHYIHRMPSTAPLTRAGASHLTRAELGVATSRVQRPEQRHMVTWAAVAFWSVQCSAGSGYMTR